MMPLFAALAAAAAAASETPVVEMAEPHDVPPLFGPGKVAPATPEEWHDGRRAEIKRLLEQEVYGERPVERPPHLVFSEVEPESAAMDGAAVRRRVRIEYGGAFGTNSFVVTAFIPRREGPAPAFLLICNRDPEKNIDPTRRNRSGFWPAEEIVARGYAAVAFYNGEISPDRQHGNTLGVFDAFEDVELQYRPRTEWGMLSAWAWGASRVLDWIETEPRIDAKRVAVVGHSRGGKTALVAAAWDERFAMACSNDSGTGGAKLNHMDLPGSEHIVDLAVTFQYWFCRQFTRWAGRDAQAPFDQHMLVALVAPRLVCIGSATADKWAGPFGEYTTARYASPAWTDVYGKKGFVTAGFPAPESPQQEGDMSYHVRTGKHDLSPYDWGVYMDFADKHGWR